MVVTIYCYSEFHDMIFRPAKTLLYLVDVYIKGNAEMPYTLLEPGLLEGLK